MLKLLAILALWLGGTGIMAGQPNQTASDKGHNTKQGQPAIVTANSPDKQSESYADQPKPNPDTPKWYAAFERPDWWLVIIAGLTGCVIGWQSWETRKVASISKEALVFEYRPRVFVRTLKLIPVKADAGQIADWQIEMVIANIGGTRAYINPWSLRAESSFPGAVEIVQSVVGGFELAGGESRSIEVVMEGEEWRVSMRSLTFTVQQLGKEQRRYPIVSGTISYGDDNKIMRRTGFRRSWDAKEERFLPSTDPEYEYQD